MPGFGIYRVDIKDLDKLQAISRQTFNESFSETNTPENMRIYLEENLSRQKLETELKNAESQFFFAVWNGNLVGYLKLNFGNAQTEGQENNAVEIERIYVLQEFQGRQFGQMLYEKALALARERKAVYLWLGVWEKNSRAINFYKKNGFQAFDRHFFRLGNDEQVDIMMKLELKAKAE